MKKKAMWVRKLIKVTLLFLFVLFLWAVYLGGDAVREAGDKIRPGFLDRVAGTVDSVRQVFDTAVEKKAAIQRRSEEKGTQMGKDVIRLQKAKDGDVDALDPKNP